MLRRTSSIRASAKSTPLAIDIRIGRTGCFQRFYFFIDSLLCFALFYYASPLGVALDRFIVYFLLLYS
jgi:hypothetical protein